MQLIIEKDRKSLGLVAGQAAAEALGKAMSSRREITLVVATGASQFGTLDALVRADLDWGRVTVFHLDEYVGIPETHPASFRRYLKERFLERLPVYSEFVAIRGDAPDLSAELARLNARLVDRPVDVALVGIGENGHLAFNDPPADFDTTSPYLVVDLDERCRRQQLGEGWFEDLDSVPRRAVSMSIQRIMTCETIIASVPDTRKAEAVRNALEGPVSNMCPASILRTHGRARLFLDQAAASLLKPETREGFVS